MNFTCPTLIVIAALTIVSCGKKNERTPQLIEANRLHLEAMEIADQLEKQTESLSAQTRNAVERSEIDSLKNLIEVWEDNVIEVPGFPHAHGHTHGAHSHKSAPPMTDESMLDYQLQSKKAIVELKKAIEKLEGLEK